MNYHINTTKIEKSPILKIIISVPIFLLILNINYAKASDKGTFDKKACESYNQSPSDRFHGVWRKTNEDVRIRIKRDFDQLTNHNQSFARVGYVITDLEIFTENGFKKFDAIYKKNPDKISKFVLVGDSNRFSTQWKAYSKIGYVLTDIETYISSGKRQWAGILEKRSGSSALWRNFSTADFGKKRNEMAKMGLKLIDIEVHVVKNKPRWSGVWLQGKDGLLNRNYPIKEFDKMRINRKNNGYKLIDVETYKLKNKIYYAGIWEKSPQREYLNSFHSLCDLLEKDHKRSADGYELIDLERVKAR